MELSTDDNLVARIQGLQEEVKQLQEELAVRDGRRTKPRSEGVAFGSTKTGGWFTSEQKIQMIRNRTEEKQKEEQEAAERREDKQKRKMENQKKKRRKARPGRQRRRRRRRS